MLSHHHSALVTSAALRDLPLPVALGPQHLPIPHATLVEVLRDTARANGYIVDREQLALARDGRRLFGVLDLDPAGDPADGRRGRGFVLGFRNSTDTSMSIQIVAGIRVYVCDNLALSGDCIALHRRNTIHLDLEAAVQAAFDRYLLHTNILNDKITVLATVLLADEEAKARLFDVFAQRALPSRLFSVVVQNYFSPTPQMPDCEPRTVWALHNACTRTLKSLSPVRAFSASLALGRLFGLSWSSN